MPLCVFALCLAGAGAGVGMSCTSAAKRDEQNSVRHIHQLFPYNVRFRRPPAEAADPEAGPGGMDWQSNPMPNAHFDCEPLDALLKDLKLAALRTCLAGIRDFKVVTYRLMRENAPFLALSDPEAAPACLRTELAAIPLPREIFFQSNEEGSLNCYSAGLDLSGDRFLHAKVPMGKYAIRLAFPFQDVPKNDPEMRLLLLSWVLTPFWNEEQPRELNSRIVPDALCNACIGQKNRVRDTDPPPALWP